MQEGKAIRAAERAVWQALITGDAAGDAALLSDDFLGVYPDGFAGREAHAAQLASGPSISSYRLSDEHLRALGTDHVLYAYRAEYRRAGSAMDEVMLVSSIWQRCGAGWVNIFSQDTPLSGVAVP
jgi:hypothetical protein